ncbi:MAG: CPBP family intramembrane metalloprotease [SAR324 cluster bacterium]|nr:CPBP family intramembrane metalloprotease [SAR324 cluster bacterium]
MSKTHALRIKFLKTSFIGFILLLYPHFNALAISNLGCVGAGLAETFVPGLGFGLTGSYDKMLLFGGGRRLASFQYYKAIDEDGYQEDPDTVYDITTDEDTGITTSNVYINEPTWRANYYGTISSDLWMMSVGDLYINACEPSTESYSLIVAPFRFDHFYNNWMFYPPILLVAASYASFDKYSIVNYNLGQGLTEERIKNDSFSKYYLVGVGEEMLFRGTIQESFYQMYTQSFGWSPSAARHWSIFSGAAVFGLAHSGQGFTANPAAAFGFGVYEGYVYHPETGDDRDLITAIAIHSWWDLIVTYAYLHHANYTESTEQVEVPLAKVYFRF